MRKYVHYLPSIYVIVKTKTKKNHDLLDKLNNPMKFQLNRIGT